MEWRYILTPAAERDFARLDGSQKVLVLKALDKLMTNPLPRDRGGYGQPLGNKGAAALAGFLKVKLKGPGLRIVYRLIEVEGVSCVLVIGAREDSQVYEQATSRLDEFRHWCESEGLGL